MIVYWVGLVSNEYSLRQFQFKVPSTFEPWLVLVQDPALLHSESDRFRESYGWNKWQWDLCFRAFLIINLHNGSGIIGMRACMSQKKEE